MITYRFTVRKERNNAVMLRLTAMRKSSELALGISLPVDILGVILNGEIPRGYKEQAMIVRHYQQVTAGLIEDLTNEETKALSAADFQKRIREEISGRRNPGISENNGDVLPVFEEKISSAHSSSTRNLYLNTLNCVKEFCNDKDNPFHKNPAQLMFKDLNSKWVSSFDNWLETKRSLKTNSRWAYLSKFRAIINKALDDEVIDKDPVRRFKIKKEETRKRSLTIGDIRRIFNYSGTKSQQFHIDMFKLIFMLVGINATDLFNLKFITRDGRIEYRRAKTGRLYSIKVEPEALRIIEKYKGQNNLVLLSDKYISPQRYTIHTAAMLKKIGKAIDSNLIELGEKSIKEESDLSQISTYWARHTWATIAAELDIPDATISQALGHAGENTTTNVYIKRNQNKIDAANRRVLDYVLYDKK